MICKQILLLEIWSGVFSFLTVVFSSESFLFFFFSISLRPVFNLILFHEITNVHIIYFLFMHLISHSVPIVILKSGS